MGNPSSVAVGGRLRAIRVDMNLSQVAFARDVVRCTQAFISAIELGKSAPSIPLLSAIEQKGYRSSWLLTGHGSMKSTTSTPSTPSTSDSSDPSAPSESLSVRDGPCSSPSRPTITIELPPDVSAGDTILVRIDRRDHPLALIGKIIYTLPRK